MPNYGELCGEDAGDKNGSGKLPNDFRFFLQGLCLTHHPGKSPDADQIGLKHSDQKPDERLMPNA